MKKLFKKVFVSLVALAIVVPSTLIAINAEEVEIKPVEQVIVTSEDIASEIVLSDLVEVDKYVKVRDGQLKLELPQGVVVDASISDNVVALLNNANEIVIENDSEINLITKVIYEEESLMRGEGWNKITMYWNYADVYASRTTLINMFRFLGSATGFASTILWAIKDYSWMIAGVLTSVVSGWASVITKALSLAFGFAASRVTAGVNFHLDYFHGVTYKRKL